MREFGHVFNDEYLKVGDDEGDAMMVDSSSGGSPLKLLAIPTNQRAREDLVQMGITSSRRKIVYSMCS